MFHSVHVRIVRRWRFGRLVALLICAIALLCACGGPGPGPSSDSVTVSAADCQQVAAVTPDTGAATVALVMDNTRSMMSEHLPPAVGVELRKAQAANDNLIFVPVEGAGEAPEVARTIALNPDPGPASPDTDNAKAIALQCIGMWAYDGSMRPKTAGSAILDAIDEAARQLPKEILVVSDGVSNVPPLDIGALGYDADPNQIAKDLAQERALEPALARIPVTWTELGDANPPLPEAVRSDLRSLWQTVLTKAGAKVTFDSRTSSQTQSVPGQLPDDKVFIPHTTSDPVPCGTKVTIPDALLFRGDSAALQAGADTALRQVAGTLAGHPDWIAIIAGNAAHYGTTAGQQQISQQRATVVRARLATMGVSGARLRARGYGASHPLVDEFPGGVHDSAAAAKNRRVDITMGQQGCVQ